MRTNVPPIREQVFEAFVELPQKNGLPAIRLPIVFTKTTRPWTEFFTNLSRQANSGAEAEIAEDLFAGISPVQVGRNPTEQDLFGSMPPAPASSRLESLARHFLLMGA